MSVATINQKEYLKKYLSRGSDDKKKKKRKKAAQPERVQIVDDDIDLNSMQPLDGSDYNLYELAEDAPQIVGIVDERPEEIKALEVFRGSKWKIIQDENGIEDIKVTEERRVASRDDAGDRFHDIEIMPPVSRNQTQGGDSSKVQKKSKSGIDHDRKRYDEDSDASPPRRSRTTVESDESPPRTKVLRKSSSYNNQMRHEACLSRKDESPPFKRDSRDSSDRNRSDSENSDVSPPRKQSSKSTSNERVRKKSRFDSDSDVSPPRVRRNKDSDESPPRKFSVKRSNEVSRRKSRFDRDTGDSPPRRSRNKEGSAVSPQRKHKPTPKKSRFDIDSDESPRRKFHSKNDFDEYHHKSKYKQNADRLPPKDPRNKSEKVFHRGRSDSDESPLRQMGSLKLGNDKDRLPAIASKYDERLGKESSNKKLEKQERTLEGKKAGLQDAKSLRMENLEHQLREKEIFAKMSDEVSGRDAATVLRDRATGKKRDLAREAAEKAVEKEKEDKKKEKYYRWGKGLKQVEDQQSRLQEDLYEMSKPLARYADDKDLEKHLKDQEREGDPMQEYIRSQKLKKEKENPGQVGDVKQRPVYQGPAPPPNRFGIKPGYRWDGVDRSTGFEQKWFQEQNSRKALQEESYKWSTEDM